MKSLLKRLNYVLINQLKEKRFVKMPTGTFEFKISKDSENVCQIAYIIIGDELEHWCVDAVNGSKEGRLDYQQWLESQFAWKVEDACWEDFKRSSDEF